MAFPSAFDQCALSLPKTFGSNASHFVCWYLVMNCVVERHIQRTCVPHRSLNFLQMNCVVAEDLRRWHSYYYFLAHQHKAAGFIIIIIIIIINNQ